MVNSALSKNTDKGFYHNALHRSERREVKTHLSKYKGYTNDDIWLDSEDNYTISLPHGWNCCEYLYTTMIFDHWLVKVASDSGQAQKICNPFLFNRVYYMYEKNPYKYYSFWSYRRYKEELICLPLELEWVLETDWKWLKRLYYNLTNGYVFERFYYEDGWHSKESLRYIFENKDTCIEPKVYANILNMIRQSNITLRKKEK